MHKIFSPFAAHLSLSACLAILSFAPHIAEAQLLQQSDPPPVLTPIVVDNSGSERTPVDSQGPTTQIYGGTNATQKAYPWHTGIVFSDNHSSPICGGSLIAIDWILTAAHCFDDARDALINPTNPSALRLQVVLGAYDITQTSSSDHQYRNILSLIRHPKNGLIPGLSLSPGFLPYYDVALIRIEPATITSAVQTIGVPDGESATTKWPAINAAGYIMGWGLTGPNCTGSTSTILKQAQLKVQSYTAAPGEDEKLLLTFVNSNTGPYASCGDSGGSFVAIQKYYCRAFAPCSEYRVAGLSSRLYNVYMRIAAPEVRDWICGVVVARGCRVSR